MRLEKEPIRSWTSRDLLGFIASREGLRSSRSHRRSRGSRCRAFRRCHGLPSTVPEALLAGHPHPVPSARPWPCDAIRTRARPRRARQPALRHRSPAEVVATLLDEGRYLCAERTMYRILAANQRGARAAQSAQSSLLHQARAGGHGPQPPGPGHPCCWSPSTSMSCSTSSLRRGLDGCRRENAALAATLIEETCLNRAPGAHPAFGPRRAV